MKGLVALMRVKPSNNQPYAHMHIKTYGAYPSMAAVRYIYIMHTYIYANMHAVNKMHTCIYRHMMRTRPWRPSTWACPRSNPRRRHSCRGTRKRLRRASLWVFGLMLERVLGEGWVGRCVVHCVLEGCTYRHTHIYVKMCTYRHTCI